LETAMNKCGVYPTKLELRIIMNQMDKDSLVFKRKIKIFPKKIREWPNNV